MSAVEIRIELNLPSGVHAVIGLPYKHRLYAYSPCKAPFKKSLVARRLQYAEEYSA